MLFRLGCLLAFLTLLTGPARAQLINDPARAITARDTLLRQAAQLRQRAEQTTTFFTTNARRHSRRRVVVMGICHQQRAPLPTNMVRQTQWAPNNISWRHVTRYRRNGRVQERYRLTMGSKLLLKERRLNGNVIWLSIPVAYTNALGTAVRHRGLYLRTGYVLLNQEQFALPRTQP